MTMAFGPRRGTFVDVATLPPPSREPLPAEQLDAFEALDLLYRSTTCVIGHRDLDLSGKRRRVYDELLSALKTQ